MAKNSRFKQAADVRRERIWLHLGSRIRFRREQLGIAVTKAVAHVGVALQTYQEYEAGERLIPGKSTRGFSGTLRRTRVLLF